MNGILLLDSLLIACFVFVLFALPAMQERNARQLWQGKMKRAA